MVSSSEHLGKPSGVPDERMMLQPVWSTWAKFKKDIDEAGVRAFAANITTHGFTHSQLEIDDDWATAYGEMAVAQAKFPDMRKLVGDLKAAGFRTTIWVHPFANTAPPPPSITALNPANFPHWVHDHRGRPAAVFWWDGEGVMLDATSTTAADWFVKRMVDFLNATGIDSFKFDAGETNWLPDAFTLVSAAYPNQFTHDYVMNVVAAVNKAAPTVGMVETRVGSRSQSAPIFVRIMDKDSRWDDANGLATLIPVTLQFGLLGYPFVLPDMIGGNAYCNNSIDNTACPMPERELYVRWLQATTFLPAIQFSIAPWDYDDSVTSHAKVLMRMRAGKASLLRALAAEAVREGSPIVRPLWWTGDESEAALTASDAFMLGNDFIVAPVLRQGASSRMVYLPEPGAEWKSGLTGGEVLEGGQSHNISAGLWELPTFTRVPKAHYAQRYQPYL